MKEKTLSVQTLSIDSLPQDPLPPPHSSTCFPIQLLSPPLHPPMKTCFVHVSISISQPICVLGDAYGDIQCPSLVAQNQASPSPAHFIIQSFEGPFITHFQAGCKAWRGGTTAIPILILLLLLTHLPGSTPHCRAGKAEPACTGARDSWHG